MSGVKGKTTVFALFTSPFRKTRTRTPPPPIEAPPKISFQELRKPVDSSSCSGSGSGSSLSLSPPSSPKARTYSISNQSEPVHQPTTSDGSNSSLPLTPLSSPKESDYSLPMSVPDRRETAQHPSSFDGSDSSLSLTPPNTPKEKTSALSAIILAPLPTTSVVPPLNLEQVTQKQFEIYNPNYQPPKKRRRRKKRKGSDRLRKSVEEQKLLLNSRTPRFIKKSEESLSSSKTSLYGSTSTSTFQLLKTTSAPDTSRSTIPAAPVTPTTLATSSTSTTSTTPTPSARKRALSIFVPKSDRTTTKILPNLIIPSLNLNSTSPSWPVYSRDYTIDPSSKDRSMLVTIYKELQKQPKSSVTLFNKKMPHKEALDRILQTLLDFSSNGKFNFHTHKKPNDPKCRNLSLITIIDKLTSIQAFQEILDDTHKQYIQKIVLKCLLGKESDLANAVYQIVKDWDITMTPWLIPLFAQNGGELKLGVDLADAASYTYEEADIQFRTHVLKRCQFMRQFQEANNNSLIFELSFNELLEYLENEKRNNQALEKKKLTEQDDSQNVETQTPEVQHACSSEDQDTHRRLEHRSKIVDSYNEHKYTDAYFNLLFGDYIKGFNPSIEMFKGFLKSVVRAAIIAHAEVPGLQKKGRALLNQISPQASSSNSAPGTTPKINWLNLKLALAQFSECIISSMNIPESSSPSGEI